MSFTRESGASLAAFSSPAASRRPSRLRPISLTPGTVEYQLRQQQLQNMQSDPNRGMQNPAVTGVNPGVGGIERAQTGGTGGAGGAIGGLRTDGTIQRPGSGAPSEPVDGAGQPAPPGARLLRHTGECDTQPGRQAQKGGGPRGPPPFRRPARHPAGPGVMR